MKEYQDDLQVIINLINEYTEKYSIRDEDKKQVINSVYKLIPDKPEIPQMDKQEKKKEKESLDYMDSWLKAIKDMGDNMKREK